MSGSVAASLGALVATLSLVLPSIIIITIIAKALQRYAQSKLVADVFSGLRPAVTGLIAAAGLTVLELAIFPGGSGTTLLSAFDWRCALLFALILTATQLKRIGKIHPIFFILAGGAAGLLLGL